MLEYIKHRLNMLLFQILGKANKVDHGVEVGLNNENKQDTKTGQNYLRVI